MATIEQVSAARERVKDSETELEQESISGRFCSGIACELQNGSVLSKGNHSVREMAFAARRDNLFRN